MAFIIKKAWKVIIFNRDEAHRSYWYASRKGLNINVPVEGLVKTYNKPYGQYSAAQVDAHEALSSPDYCMASYGASGDIVLER